VSIDGRSLATVGLAIAGTLAWAGPSQAVTVVFQDTTIAGDSALVRDTHLRSDGIDVVSAWADGNFGTATGARLYPDVGFDAGKGPRHTLFWFDVSSIPSGATINSATLNVYLLNNSVGGDTTGFNLGCLKVPWIEGTKPGETPAGTGEPTWNNRAHPSTAWGAPGAVGTADIESDSKTFDAGPAADHWETIDVTDWVQSWVSGARPNQGMIIYGGQNMSGYFWIDLSELADTSLRPRLTVTYNSTGDSGVSIDLGTTNAENGIVCPSTGDGDNTPVSMGGVDCRRNLDPNSDYYMYLNVSDAYAYQGSRPELDITIRYYDAGTGSLTLQYDSPGGQLADWYKVDGSVALTNTGTWLEHTYHVADAYFGNRENYGTDFRIAGGVGSTFYLDMVQVTVGAPVDLPPVIAEVSPDPDTATVGEGYTRQLSLLQGRPAPTWSIVQAPPGAQISAGGLVTGWVASPCDMGSPITFEVRAENDLGSDTEIWQVSAQFASAGTSLILNDPLQGSTLAPSTGGQQQGGSFVTGGWKVTGAYDCIFWHVTPVAHGAFEYDVTGLGSGCSVSTKNELSHMYDWTFGNADFQYSGGYRDDPYKHFIRKQCDPGKEYTCEMLWQAAGCSSEPDSGGLAWSSTATYRFRVEWEPSGSDTVARIYRDSTLLWQGSCPGTYAPGGLSLRIGASNRHAGEDAFIGAIYSNVKYWDLSIAQTTPPVIQDVTPDPDTAWYGHEYTKQLSLLQGTPAPGWCLLEGPAGAQINAASGLVTGWAPSTGQIGQLVTFTAKAANVAGTDTRTWQVLVKARGDLDGDADCDQEDFGLFQACLSGDGAHYPAGCEDGDLNGDNDVDQDDTARFLNCLSGAGVAVLPDCAD
jgi:hypothetical protein